MDDPWKQLADQSMNGKPGAPRFDPAELRYAELNDYYVTFYLRTHAVAVTIGDLTAEEAQLARLYLQGRGRQDADKKSAGAQYSKKTAGIGDSVKGPTEAGKAVAPVRSARDRQEAGKERAIPDKIAGSTPWYIVNYRIIMVAILLIVVIGFMGIVSLMNYSENQQFERDKNEAIAIAMQDSSLRSFVSGKAVTYQSTADYYNPQSPSKRSSMSVDIDVWVKDNKIDPTTNQTSNMPSRIEQFTIVVDLENSRITSSKEIMIWPYYQMIS